MAYGRRRPVSWIPLLVAWVLGTIAIYVVLFGAGTGMSGLVRLGVAAGVALPVIGVAVWTVLMVRAREDAWVRGTGRVVNAIAPPESSELVLGTIELVVEAPGYRPTMVRVHGQGIPVASWPRPGDVLPVRIHADDPRRVQILWDETPDESLLPAAPSIPPFRPLEDEPSDLVARYLFPTERYRGEWRRHWVRPVRTQLAMLAITLLGIVAARLRVRPDLVLETVAVACTVGALVAGRAPIAWYVNRFALTNKRILLVEGALRRRVSSIALLRMTDLRYVQAVPGRVLNYGDLLIEGAGRLGRARRIADLPNPNELYLRLVEELYEPIAVEARLGRGYGDPEDDVVAPVSAPPAGTDTETLTVALREALYGPTLANYDGWVSVDVREEGRRVAVSEDRQVRLRPGRSYELQVMITANPRTDITEPLVVTGGVDRETVEFAVEVDSDQRALRRPGQPLVVGGDGGVAFFAIRMPDEEFGTPPWLWVRISQHRRLLQSIELTAVGAPVLER